MIIRTGEGIVDTKNSPIILEYYSNKSILKCDGMELCLLSEHYDKIADAIAQQDKIIDFTIDSDDK